MEVWPQNSMCSELWAQKAHAHRHKHTHGLIDTWVHTNMGAHTCIHTPMGNEICRETELRSPSNHSSEVLPILRS